MLPSEQKALAKLHLVSHPEHVELLDGLCSSKSKRRVANATRLAGIYFDLYPTFSLILTFILYGTRSRRFASPYGFGCACAPLRMTLKKAFTSGRGLLLPSEQKIIAKQKNSLRRLSRITLSRRWASVEF